MIKEVPEESAVANEKLEEFGFSMEQNLQWLSM